MSRFSVVTIQHVLSTLLTDISDPGSTFLTSLLKLSLVPGVPRERVESGDRTNWNCQ